MKKLLSVLVCIILFSCSTPDTTIMTRTRVKINGIEKSDSIYSNITTEYVDLTIYSYQSTNGKWGVLDEKAVFTDSNNFKIVTQFLVDKNSKKEIWFDKPVDFVNYMSKNGYNMIDKIESEFHTKYSFKKK